MQGYIYTYVYVYPNNGNLSGREHGTGAIGAYRDVFTYSSVCYTYKLGAIIT